MIGLPSQTTLIGAAVLVALLGVQTVRLAGAHTTIAKQEADAADFRADLEKKHAEGIQEGVKQQQAAQAELDAKHTAVVEGLKADNDKLRGENAAKATRIRSLTNADKWQCLRDPLPDDVLKEFQRP